MFHLGRKFSWVLFAGFLSLFFSVTSFAEASKSENSVTGFFKRLFNYSGNTVKETATTAGNTLSNTGEKVVEPTAENTTAVVSGDVAKTGDLVVEPVVGAAETLGQTASETVQIPVKAAQEEAPPAAA